MKTLAILVGGGPAPGINGVIAAATIEAINSGLRVIGIRQGYHWLARGDASRAAELQIADVSRIHFTGGSILGTARSAGTTVVESLMEDARTTARWYTVVTMGRGSGALALGMCKAAGATLA